MIALLCFLLTLFASPFKSNSRLAAENAPLRHQLIVLYARSVGQPESAALGLLRWDLQPLASPDTLDPLVVNYPARLPQQFGDLAIAVAAVLLGKLDNIGRETLLVVTTTRDLALWRAMLPERRTGATLGDMQLRSDLLNAGAATRGA
jgi:hypothetical protein